MPITISGSTGIAGVNGSAGTPAIQGTDTDSGVYFSGSQVGFSSNGAGTTMTIDGSGNVTYPGTVVMSSPFGFRNKLINGSFQFWQRGTSGTGAIYVADRWASDQTNTTQAQSSDVPTGVGSQYSLQVSASSGTAATCQRVESINARPLAGKVVTLSFYAKAASGTPTLNFDIRYANAVNNFSTATIMQGSTVSLSTSWTKYTFTFSALNSNSANGVVVFFYNVATQTFLLSQVQLEEGSIATPFEFRSSQQELAMCQRYYQQQLNNGSRWLQTMYQEGQYLYGVIPLQTTLRTTPTVTAPAASSFDIWGVGAPTAITIDSSTVERVVPRLTKTGLTNYSAYILSGDGTYFTFSAEL